MARSKSTSGASRKVRHDQPPSGNLAKRKREAAAPSKYASSSRRISHIWKTELESFGFSRARSGTTSCRRRFRRGSSDAFEESSTWESACCSRYAVTSARETQSIGRMILPRFGGMPHRPRSAVPRTRLSRTVSKLSSCVCAVATGLLRLSKNWYRRTLAASSTLSPVCLQRDRTSARETVSRTPRLSQRLFTNASSRSDSAPRSWWFRCAASTVMESSF